MPSTENIEIQLKNVRITFAQVFAPVPPKDDPNGKKTFSASFLIPKDTAEGKTTHAAVKAAMGAAARAKWGDNIPKDVKTKPEKLCMRDGDNESYDGYPGNWFVSSRSPENRRPTVVGRNRKPVTSNDGVIYSGCVVNAVIRIWAQDNEFGKRINASLEGVQFVADAPAFGAKPLSEDAFDELDDEGFTDSGSPESSDDSLI